MGLLVWLWLGERGRRRRGRVDVSVHVLLWGVLDAFSEAEAGGAKVSARVTKFFSGVVLLLFTRVVCARV